MKNHYKTVGNFYKLIGTHLRISGYLAELNFCKLFMMILKYFITVTIFNTFLIFNTVRPWCKPSPETKLFYIMAQLIRMHSRSLVLCFNISNISDGIYDPHYLLFLRLFITIRLHGKVSEIFVLKVLPNLPWALLGKWSCVLCRDFLYLRTYLICFHKHAIYLFIYSKFACQQSWKSKLKLWLKIETDNICLSNPQRL